MLTDSRLPLIATSEDKVADIILKLNSKKAHGYDDISIAMLKLCAPAVAKALNMIFLNVSLKAHSLIFGNLLMPSLSIKKTTAR